MKLTKTILAASIAAATAMPNIAAAYEAGDILVRGRIINVNPNSDSGEVTPIGGAAIAGATVEAEDNFSLDIDITYMMAPNWGVELLLDLSSQHDVKGTGAALSGTGTLVETNVLPPSLLLQYHFAPNAKFRPYVGAGVNYTLFFNEKGTDNLDAVGESLTGSAPGTINTTVNLEPSFGLAAQVGADFDLNETWFANVDLKYIDIDTEATIRANGARFATVDVDIDPWVFGVGIGRRF